jgi:hypothetical protein
MARHGHEFPTWGEGNNAPADVRAGEVTLECEVSKVIGTMPFLWLTVDGEPGAESVRGYVERNVIALLSNYRKESLDPPSAGWLGHSCNRERVRRSGLWNSNHIDDCYEPALLKCMERLVRDMERAA